MTLSRYSSPGVRTLQVTALVTPSRRSHSVALEVRALRGIDLQIEKGKRLAIIGKNGAGKSTLLKIVTGKVLPTEGTIQVDGKIQALMQMGTGFHPEFSGRQNIQASLSYSGIGRRRIKMLEDEIIDFSELEEFIDQPVKYYSSGMYSRLAFAVATVLEPEILIIDEVLGAGDAAFTTKCADRMKRLTRDIGSTVLFVSHSMASVLEICEDAVLLERGQITANGKALEVSKIYNKMIREEEELYFRAKEYKMKKHDVRAIRTVESSHEVLLFRLVSLQPHPAMKHKIYRCQMQANEKTVIDLDVGGAMDNDIQATTRIIDGSGVMDWGKPGEDERGAYRTYSDERGSNCHAPFQMALPKHYTEQNLRLFIEAESFSKDPVFMELWDGKAYKRVGQLASGYAINTFKLDDFFKRKKSEADPDTDILENFRASNSVYGNQRMVISFADIVDQSLKSKRTFTVGESLNLLLDIQSQENIEHFVVVAAIMDSAGKAVSQVFCESEELNYRGFTGKDRIQIAFSPTRIGAGEYMVSLGLFEHYDLRNEAENPSYCVIDRALFFKMRQPDSMKKVIGAVAHECIFSNGKYNNLYDPAEHYVGESSAEEGI